MSHRRKRSSRGNPGTIDQACQLPMRHDGYGNFFDVSYIKYKIRPGIAECLPYKSTRAQESRIYTSIHYIHSASEKRLGVRSGELGY